MRGPRVHRGIAPDASVDRHVVRIGLRIAARIAHLYGKVVSAVKVRTGLVKKLCTADRLLIAGRQRIVGGVLRQIVAGTDRQSAIAG